MRPTRAPISFLCLPLWLRGTTVFSSCILSTSVCACKSTILLLAATIPNLVGKEDRGIAGPDEDERQDWSARWRHPPSLGQSSSPLCVFDVYVFELSNLPWKDIDGWSGKTSNGIKNNRSKCIKNRIQHDPALIWERLGKLAVSELAILDEKTVAPEGKMLHRGPLVVGC